MFTLMPGSLLFYKSELRFKCSVVIFIAPHTAVDYWNIFSYGFFHFSSLLALYLQFFDLMGVSGLADHDNYHEYCRLLGRFRVNYQVFFF